MRKPYITRLRLSPGKLYFEAQILPLSFELAEQISHTWWAEPWLDEGLTENEIDRNWDWHEAEIEFDNRIVNSIALGLVVEEELQGAMLLSEVGIPSAVNHGTSALLLERLFTAPRNRPHLLSDRIDEAGQASKRGVYTGVGTALIKWAAEFSLELGYGGRLRLDASPDFVDWYSARHFEKLEVSPVFHEGVCYTPMELGPSGAQRMLQNQRR